MADDQLYHLRKRTAQIVAMLAISSFIAFAARSNRTPSHGPETGFQDAVGREANVPTEIPPLGWKDITYRVYSEFGDDRLLAVAAGVTFYALLAIFPAIAAIVSLYGLFADRAALSGHLDLLSGLLPGGALEIVGEQLARLTDKPNSALGAASVFGLTLALWSANAGVKAMFDALNVVYDETEKRSFVMLNLTSLVFTTGAVLFLVATVLTVSVAPIVIDYAGLSAFSNNLVTLLRWPAMAIVASLMFSLLYRFGPSRERAKWAWVTPGSILAAVGWIIVSALFSWYAAHFGSYNETYGTLGAGVGLMTWIWLSTAVVLIGAELNAEAEHQTRRDSTTGASRPMGARGAAMADTLGRSHSAEQRPHASGK